MIKKDALLLSDDLFCKLRISQINTVKKSKRSIFFSKIINVMIENNSENILQCNRGKV